MKVVIGIQARSTSTRFPRKSFEKIDGKEILQHVLDVCEESAQYLNRYGEKSGLDVSTVILVPFNDEIVPRYKYKSIVFEGPEEDVLTRYMNMSKELGPDFIVRVTADCPLLPSYIISKHVNIATRSAYDYVSNVDENIRTCVDGHDVEVISKKALSWLNENAKEPKEREHVTMALRTAKIPPDLRVAHVVGQLYQPHIKLSVDTPEDLERVRKEYFNIKSCITAAKNKSGRGSVYRI